MPGTNLIDASPGHHRWKIGIVPTASHFFLRFSLINS